MFCFVYTGYNMQQLQEFVEGEVEKGLLGLERILKQAVDGGFFTDIPLISGDYDPNWKYKMVRTIIRKINPNYVQHWGVRKCPVRLPGPSSLLASVDPPITSIVKLYSSYPIFIRYEEEALPRRQAPSTSGYRL
jgi:hypothetical protein